MNHKKIIVYFSIPAYGHVNPTLPLIEKLIDSNYDVIYFSVARFQSQVIKTGAEYREYQLDNQTFDLDQAVETDFAADLLGNYLKILQILPDLVKDLVAQLSAENRLPDLIIHDSLASWGRYIAEFLDKPVIAFNNFVAIDRYFKPSYWAYAKVLNKILLKDIKILPKIWLQRLKLLKFRQTGMTSINFNKEKLNVMAFHPLLQKGGEYFGEDYFFLGPAAVLREERESSALTYPTKKVIYATLGTMSQNQQFVEGLFSELGNSDYIVILSGLKKTDHLHIPSNFIIKPFVNQLEVLSNACLFISTGGMNSINDALSQLVPCLIYPTNAEKKLNAINVEKAGVGEIIQDFSNLKNQAERVIKLAEMSEFQILAKEMTTVNLTELVRKLETYMKKETHYESVNYW